MKKFNLIFLCFHFTEIHQKSMRINIVTVTLVVLSSSLSSFRFHTHSTHYFNIDIRFLKLLKVKFIFRHIRTLSNWRVCANPKRKSCVSVMCTSKNLIKILPYCQRCCRLCCIACSQFFNVISHKWFFACKINNIRFIVHKMLVSRGSFSTPFARSQNNYFF